MLFLHNDFTHEEIFMKLKALVVALGIAGTCGCVFASANQSAQVATELKQVTKEMQQLQSQVTVLRTQVTGLKGQLRKRHRMHKRKAKRMSHHGKKAHAKNNGAIHAAPFGVPVVTAPYTSVPPHNNGSSFIVNAPTINEDAKLLARRMDEMQYYQKRYGHQLSRPRLVLSGDLTGIAQYTKTYRQKYNSDIDLTGADLDAYVEVAPWVSGLMEFSYTNDAAPESTRRISDSNVYLNQGFLTIGNFMKSPIYGSIGQLYVPFGRYASMMISDPLTKFVGKTKARALSIGYEKAATNAPYAEGFIFRTAAATSSQTKINDGGVDFGYRYSHKKFRGDIGFSYLYDIAASEGMQDNGRSSGFMGFSNMTSDRLRHAVGGADLYGLLGYKAFTAMFEYTTALRRFSKQNLTYNGHGAKPAAYTIEGDYAFRLFKMPATFGLAYQGSHDALGLNIPTKRYLAALQLLVRKYTLFTLEFRHDTNYGKSATATGQGSANIAYTSNELGKGSNVVTAQIATYF
jgi:hypothetical protein